MARTFGAAALIVAFAARGPVLMINMARHFGAADHCGTPAHSHAPASERCCDLCALGCVTTLGAPAVRLALVTPTNSHAVSAAPSVPIERSAPQHRLPYSVGPPPIRTA